MNPRCGVAMCLLLARILLSYVTITLVMFNPEKMSRLVSTKYLTFPNCLISHFLFYMCTITIVVLRCVVFAIFLSDVSPIQTERGVDFSPLGLYYTYRVGGRDLASRSCNGRGLL